MNEEMKDAFFDWMNECPTQWFLDNHGTNFRTYSFTFDNEDSEDDN